MLFSYFIFVCRIDRLAENFSRRSTFRPTVASNAHVHVHNYNNSHFSTLFGVSRESGARKARNAGECHVKSIWKHMNNEMRKSNKNV